MEFGVCKPGRIQSGPRMTFFSFVILLILLVPPFFFPFLPSTPKKTTKNTNTTPKKDADWLDRQKQRPSTLEARVQTVGYVAWVSQIPAQVRAIACYKSWTFQLKFNICFSDGGRGTHQRLLSLANTRGGSLLYLFKLTCLFCSSSSSSSFFFFVLFKINRPGVEETKAKLNKLFTFFDSDGSGHVSTKELLHAMTSLGVSPSTQPSLLWEQACHRGGRTAALICDVASLGRFCALSSFSPNRSTKILTQKMKYKILILKYIPVGCTF